MTRLIQLRRAGERRIALIDEPRVQLLDGFTSNYALARSAVEREESMMTLVNAHLSDQSLDYAPLYSGEGEWEIMLPFDHPDEPARCLVSGTGLTHLGSAKDRQSMHADEEKNLTDSMKMFRWGVEKGKPADGAIGISPEWFFKGNGTILRAHNQALDIPRHAEDGGEEAEIAGVYLIAADGSPRRVGMAIGNEFSDHRFEKRNYLNLAGSKLRTCSLGPELVIDPQFASIPGQVSIERAGKTLWTKSIHTGEDEMCHSLANIEHHHFKFDAHRRPSDVHVHYYGAHSLSFGDGVELADGDTMLIAFEGFGRPLRNPLRRSSEPDAAVKVTAL